MYYFTGGGGSITKNAEDMYIFVSLIRVELDLNSEGSKGVS